MVKLFSRSSQEKSSKPRTPITLGWLGFIGGLLKVVSALYLVFILGLFSSVKSVLASAERLALQLESQGGFEPGDAAALVAYITGGLRSILAGNALGIAAALFLWILGTILFSREWERIAGYWPSIARRAFHLFTWLSRLGALAAGVVTGLILSRLSGDMSSIAAGVRLSYIVATLYLLPLLPPVVYSLLSLKYPPPSSRAGVLLLLAGAVLYVYSMYSVIQAFRPLSAVAGPLEEVLRGGLNQHSEAELVNGFIEALRILMDRVRNTLIALALASAFYTLGFAVIGFRRRP
ncbi:hypothetical protein [Aeropyrum camini]|uniref:Uncharacterized protein n=1 Tax=Aeropyrum camini SY1 = JCM 12091 TaxID=1198449 RepID=U3TDP4_9CREN|nr:hypothetical protein [Aeropyrum camini]BAN90125.1 hypothetical protein ACAM_0656 [Aeropyrum camini SY1 = JCM 12091]